MNPLLNVMATIAVGALFVGCAKAPPASPVNRIDSTDAAEGGNILGVESDNIIEVADNMARELLSWGGFQKMEKAPALVVMTPENRTRFKLDTRLVSDRFVEALVKNAEGAFMIYDRSAWDAIQTERALKEEGTVGGQISGAVAGADYFLKSELRDLSTSDGRTETSFVQVNFRMIDASTSALIWTEVYDWKKAGSWGTDYQ